MYLFKNFIGNMHYRRIQQNALYIVPRGSLSTAPSLEKDTPPPQQKKKKPHKRKKKPKKNQKNNSNNKLNKTKQQQQMKRHGLSPWFSFCDSNKKGIGLALLTKLFCSDYKPVCGINLQCRTVSQLVFS